MINQCLYDQNLLLIQAPYLITPPYFLEPVPEINNETQYSKEQGFII